MDALAALRLQIEWGADEALEDEPQDRLAAASVSVVEAASLDTSAFRLPAQVAAVPAPAVTLASRAQDAAAAAADIAQLQAAMAEFEGCALRQTASHMVLSGGNPNADLVFIADVPGDDDDRTGTALAGDAGALFDRMLASVGLSRESCQIIHAVPWRPPGGRPPTEAEIQTCLPFLNRYLALLRPRYVILLGHLPARMLIPGRNGGVRRLRGRWHSLQVNGQVPGLEESLTVLSSLHPAHLLATPSAKADAWADFLMLRRRLDEDKIPK